VIIEPLSGKAREAVRLTTASINIFEGAVRSGKTIASLIAWLAFVRTGPAGPLLMVGKTERTLARNIIDVLVEMLGPARCKLIAGTGELWLLGRKVYLAGANDERSQEKIRGLTLAGAYVDEATTAPASFWNMLRSRLSVEGARLIATTNPEGPNHYLKKDWLDRARLHLTGAGQLHSAEAGNTIDLARFSFRLADNPTLGATFLANVERDYVGLWRRRMIDGEWTVAEGAVYDMFDPDAHVIDLLPQMRRWIAIGVDYGTVNPFDAVLLGLAGGRLYAVAELRYDSRVARRQRTDAEHSTALRSWLAAVRRPGEQDTAGVSPEWACVDPSAASFIAQCHRDGLRNVTAADNSVLDGIRTVSSLLAGGRLLVHRSCAALIEELPSYSWDPKAAEKGEDRPIKVADHAVDACRYACRTTESIWRRQVNPNRTEEAV
jgi:PBSX family phage terminase large subunit